MDSWVGHSKQEIVMNWGPPARTASDGSDGEILIYASTYWGPTSWKYTMFYLNSSHTVYHWLIQTAYVPPAQLDVNLYTH